MLLHSIVPDPDGNQETSDDEKFDIDENTGQLKTKAALNFEVPGYAVSGASTYTVTIRATDPSGAMGMAIVSITLNDVNEKPAFAEGDPNVTEHTVAENVDLGATPLATYEATDPDNEGRLGTDTVTYGKEGADKDLFNVGANSGVLTFVEDHTPDFEVQPSYSITITAIDDDDSPLTGKLPVTVKVTDAEDPGTVTIMVLEPQEGSSVAATVSDPDGGIIRKTWQWWRRNDSDNDRDCTGETEAFDPIVVGATSFIYMPKTGDIGYCLQATATYADNILTDTNTDGVDDRTDTASFPMLRPVQQSSPANTAPKFVDQDPDTAGDQSEETTREVPENTDAGEAIGEAITAGDANGDWLTYSIGGDDSDSFDIERTDGQLKTKAALDYETRDSYMVLVTATDPSGASDVIL